MNDPKTAVSDPKTAMSDSKTFPGEAVQISKQDNGVATVTLNVPNKHNAFDDRIIAQLTKAFHSIDDDDAVKVMVLAANGKSFSAGGDLQWMKRMANYSFEDNLADARTLAEMLKTLNGVSKPTIARGAGRGIRRRCRVGKLL